MAQEEGDRGHQRNNDAGDAVAEGGVPLGPPAASSAVRVRTMMIGGQ